MRGEPDAARSGCVPLCQRLSGWVVFRFNGFLASGLHTLVYNCAVVLSWGWRPCFIRVQAPGSCLLLRSVCVSCRLCMLAMGL